MRCIGISANCDCWRLEMKAVCEAWNCRCPERFLSLIPLSCWGCLFCLFLKFIYFWLMEFQLSSFKSWEMMLWCQCSFMQFEHSLALPFVINDLRSEHSFWRTWNNTSHIWGIKLQSLEIVLKSRSHLKTTDFWLFLESWLFEGLQIVFSEKLVWVSEKLIWV